MLLGKIELNESTDLQFDLEVHGTTESAKDVRFVIEGKDYDITCKCQVKEGVVSAKIPPLKGVLSSGVYESRLEVIVGDKFFVPLKEQIELNPLIEFDVKKKLVAQVNESVVVEVKPSLKDNIQKAMAEGYELTKIGENYIMKKDEMYCGLVSEVKVLKCAPQTTITEMIEALE